MRLSSLILFTLAVLFSFKPLQANSPEIATDITGTDTPEGKRVVHKLNSIIIPKVYFDKLDIAAVIDFLNIKSKELDPDHLGIKFILRLPQTEWPHRMMSISLENVSLTDLLGYVSNQTDLHTSIIKGAVVLKPFDPAVDATPTPPAGPLIRAKN